MQQSPTPSRPTADPAIMSLNTDNIARFDRYGPVYQGVGQIGAFYMPAAPWQADYVLEGDQLQINLSRYRCEAAVDSDRWGLEETFGTASTFLPAGSHFRGRCDPDALGDNVIMSLPTGRFDQAAEAAGLPRGIGSYAWGVASDRLSEIGTAVRTEMLEGARDGFEPLGIECLIEDALSAFVEAVAEQQGAARRKGGLTKAQLRRVIQRIEDSLSDPVSLEDLAAEAGLSQHHFARQFRETTRQSPYAFVLDHRLSKAIWMLKETDAKLAEIAFRCGFADQAHFTKHFKKRIGVAPKQYRRLISL
ncbi:MAG: AraC family transcriptional regulator [Pseudomonadota bacterium]